MFADRFDSLRQRLGFCPYLPDRVLMGAPRLVHGTHRNKYLLFADACHKEGGAGLEGILVVAWFGEWLEPFAKPSSSDFSSEKKQLTVRFAQSRGIEESESQILSRLRSSQSFDHSMRDDLARLSHTLDTLTGPQIIGFNCLVMGLGWFIKQELIQFILTLSRRQFKAH